MELPKYLIVCGCYRSGTSIISIMLSHHPQLIVTDEMFYFLASRRLNNKLNRIFKKLPEHVYRPGIPYEALKDNYKPFILDIIKDYPNIGKIQFIKKLIAYSKKDILYYGDKVPEYIFRLSYLKDIYRPKVIVCLRDPRDIICSQIRNYKKHIKMYGNTIGHFWMKPNVKSCINMGNNWYKYIHTWDNIKSTLDYYELRYASILNNPKLEDKNLSNFLSIQKGHLTKVFKKIFISNKYGEWKKSFPNINKQIPKEWKRLMNQYGFKI